MVNLPLFKKGLVRPWKSYQKKLFGGPKQPVYSQQLFVFLDEWRIEHSAVDEIEMPCIVHLNARCVIGFNRPAKKRFTNIDQFVELITFFLNDIFDAFFGFRIKQVLDGNYI